MLIIMESIVVCFIMLVVCIVGLKNGPESYVVFYEKDVQKRVVELGYTTEKQMRKSARISKVVLFIPLLILVPFMVYRLNGTNDFKSLFLQMAAVYLLSGLFDRLFIDWFWVEHTKAWLIPGTEDLMPYIPKKTKIKKWAVMIVGIPILSACMTGLLSFIAVPLSEELPVPETVYVEGYEHVQNYVLEDSADEFKTVLSINPDTSEFAFSYDPLSSYFYHGKYETKDNQIIAKTDDGNHDFNKSTERQTLI